MNLHKLQNWQPPFTGKSSTQLFAKAKMGVYLIREVSTHKIVYIGMSTSCAHKALYRHFYAWNDPKQYRATYTNRNDYEVTIIICASKTETETLEKELINFFNPPDNREFYFWYWNKKRKMWRRSKLLWCQVLSPNYKNVLIKKRR